MEKIRKILKIIIYPPLPAAVTFLVLSFIYLAAVMFNSIEGVPAYLAYFMSAAGVYYLIAACIIPIVKKIYSDDVVSSYFTDREFTARFGLYTGAAVNMIYALFKMISGIAMGSVWFIAVGFYYIFLFLIRGSLVKADVSIYKNRESISDDYQWKAYRNTGFLMLTLDIALTGIIVLVVKHDNSFVYPDFMIYASAFYAFYRMVLAVRGLIIDRKDRSPVVSAVRCINFSAAAVAMFTLQTAMLARFSKDPSYDRMINTITGILVSVIIGVISVYMIIRGIVKLRKDSKTLR